MVLHNGYCLLFFFFFLRIAFYWNNSVIIVIEICYIKKKKHNNTAIKTLVRQKVSMKDTVNFFQTQCDQQINPKNAIMYCKDNSVDATVNHEDLSLENEE